MSFVNIAEQMGKYLLRILKWSFLGVLMGVLGGLLGVGFHHALSFVTDVRGQHGWLIFLLPVGGVLTVLLYRLFKLQTNRGTNEVIDSVLQGKKVSPLITPAIFIATTITHFFGGSAGREGAALQLGGSAASLVCRIFRISEKERPVMIACGMSAVFSGLFCLPLTACLFTLEFESVGSLLSPALFPCFISALIAAKLSAALGGHAVTVVFDEVMPFTFDNIWKIVVLAVLISLVGILMCNVFHKMEHFAQKLIKSPYYRIIVGAAVIVVMTLLVGDQRYNGAGMEMALQAIGGSADWYSFILKILFTAVTLAAGFKGGEIVPTFCIGATFGCFAGYALGFNPGFAAALCLVALFCCVTNSPIASIVLSIEMFGGANIYMFVLVCLIAFILSGNSSLYASQILEFSKSTMTRKK